MLRDPANPNEPPGDKLASSLRDLLLLVIAFGMIGWLVYFGFSAISTAHLDLGLSVRPSRRWFFGPLAGTPAVLAGYAFLCLAAAFLSIALSHPLFINRAPALLRRAYWLFFPAFLALYIVARIISGK
jgi:hypothetical protein